MEKRSPEHLRQPEFSQPLVTALQLCILAVLETWGIKPRSAVGHSSGEIAAAYAAGLLNRAGAIIAAFYRGRAAVNRKTEAEGDVGMLAVGLEADAASEFLEKYVGKAWIACFNSPSSVTVSGKIETLEALREEISAAGHFARRLQVDLAYHSELMCVIGEEYEKLLTSTDKFHTIDNRSDVTLFPSVTVDKKNTAADARYWKRNMVSPVRFEGALKAMLEDTNAPNFLIEIGPSGALAGPVSQILKSLPASVGGEISYGASWSRGTDAGKSLFDIAGRLFVAGVPIDMSAVNQYDGEERTIVDLPNYTWNHSVKYWHENAASKDWRFRKYVVHDLIGSKILGSSWHAPQWRSRLNVANLPWLMDHKMGGNAITPGAVFITMALEALYQKHRSLLRPGEGATLAPNDLSYRFRNVRFSRAMVLEEGKDVLITFSLTKVPGSKDWHEFHIQSTEGDVVSEHCDGLVRVQDPIDEQLEGEEAKPLKSPQNPKLWYKGQREIGMDFGPAFQRLIEIEAVTGQRQCRTLMSLEPPESKYSPQSYYPIHPAALDGCLQTPVPSNAQCDRTNLLNVMIPAIIDDVVINKVPAKLRHGLSKATSIYGGRGRLELEKNWVANTSVYDSQSGQLLMKITGLNYVRLDVAPKPDPHTFHRVSWKPDITFLTQDQMMYLTPQKASTKLDTVVDLIAHKKPALKVLEVNLEDADTSCMWFEARDSSTRAAYSQYDFASPDAKTIVNVEAKYEETGNTSFLHISPDQEALGLPSEAAYDLAIIKTTETTSTISIEDLLKHLKPLLSEEAFTLLVQPKDEGIPAGGKECESADAFRGQNQSPSQETPDVPSESSGSLAGDPASRMSSTAFDDEAAVKTLKSSESNVSGSVMEIGATSKSSPAYLWRRAGASSNNVSQGNLVAVRLAESAPENLPPSLQATLQASGWTITQETRPTSKPADGSVTLVLDELWDPVLTKADEKQWEAIKMLVNSGNPLLWVTKGAQHPVTHPDNAMIIGLLRVARQELGIEKLTTLDVQSSTSPATNWAIEKVLALLKSGATVETEYMERNGKLFIQRVMPDKAVNDFRHAEAEGLEPVVKDFHGTKVQVQLRAERLGTLNSLMWCETETEEAALAEGQIEVEVMATGVNFKDVAITMGIVSDNEYNIGFECAGIVKRLVQGVNKFKVGDRICMLKAGSYANRVRVAADRCHAIPDTMSFEEAATIPSVYLCSLYAMYHLGCLKEGQVRISSPSLEAPRD